MPIKQMVLKRGGPCGKPIKVSLAQETLPAWSTWVRGPKACGPDTNILPSLEVTQWVESECGP